MGSSSRDRKARQKRLDHNMLVQCNKGTAGIVQARAVTGPRENDRQNRPRQHCESNERLEQTPAGPLIGQFDRAIRLRRWPMSRVTRMQFCEDEELRSSQ